MLDLAQAAERDECLDNQLAGSGVNLAQPTEREAVAEHRPAARGKSILV